jgi:homoisocitrate dehydrogenase
MVTTHTIKLCVIGGDGIGPEVTKAALDVLHATRLPLQVVEAEAGWACFERHGTALPEATLAAARGSDAVLFGAVASPSHPVPGYRSPIVALRRALDLYANIRPTTCNLQSAIDLVVVRENTEGLYAGRERVENDGATAIAERVITRQASERITRVACDIARERAGRLGRQGRVTVVHKANVLRETCGLFRRAALEVAHDYPDLAVDELLIDTAAMHLARDPGRFDVVVTTNLFGDILSDVACIWGGGLGLAPSANIGTAQALFEPVHGAAPDIVGTQRANPLAAIRCVALLLHWLAPRHGDALANWSRSIDGAAAAVMAHGPHTPDMGGAATTEEVAGAVISSLRSL